MIDMENDPYSNRRSTINNSQVYGEYGYEIDEDQGYGTQRTEQNQLYQNGMRKRSVAIDDNQSTDANQINIEME